ncbi:DUF4333 domain-containing protein [Mycolicibacterium sp.]|uniref:DUF4333 domain-containing protein n=1 Tax=Mycolicibacterium sp. TaxID=2320850 RepID=UPI0037CB0A3C
MSGPQGSDPGQSWPGQQPESGGNQPSGSDAWQPPSNPDDPTTHAPAWQPPAYTQQQPQQQPQQPDYSQYQQPGQLGYQQPQYPATEQFGQQGYQQPGQFGQQPGQYGQPPQFGQPQFGQPQYGQPGQFGQQPGQFGQPGQYGQYTPPGGEDGSKKSLAMIGIVAIGAAALVVIAVAITAFWLPGWAVTTVLDINKAQSGVENILKDDTNGYGNKNVSGVKCNNGENPEVKKGSTFDCDVSIDGTKRKVTVTFQDDKGTYEVGRPK